MMGDMDARRFDRMMNGGEQKREQCRRQGQMGMHWEEVAVCHGLSITKALAVAKLVMARRGQDGAGSLSFEDLPEYEEQMALMFDAWQQGAVAGRQEMLEKLREQADSKPTMMSLWWRLTRDGLGGTTPTLPTSGTGSASGARGPLRGKGQPATPGGASNSGVWRDPRSGQTAPGSTPVSGPASGAPASPGLSSSSPGSSLPPLSPPPLLPLSPLEALMAAEETAAEDEDTLMPPDLPDIENLDDDLL